jgi:predicted nucleic acid-binding protein
MIMVDTSIWISHFRKTEETLSDLLMRGMVTCHPYIIGEIACGNLRNRNEIMTLLQSLPMTIQAEHEEVLQFIEMNKIMGQGIGYIDAHLLVSAFLTKVSIWTFDKKLQKVARMLTDYNNSAIILDKLR